MFFQNPPINYSNLNHKNQLIKMQNKRNSFSLIQIYYLILKKILKISHSIYIKRIIKGRQIILFLHQYKVGFL